MEKKEFETRSLKDSLESASCYTGNLSELASEVGDVLVEDDGGKIVLNFEGGVKLLQVVWNKVKETADECAGKQIEVRLPDGLLGSIVAAALSLIGFRL